MKIAVLSDIHGNMDALEQVLADIDGRGVASVLSLGDNIGYGAEPERVVQTLKAHGILSVLGNHELAAKNPGFLGWFNPAARKSLAMTFRMLSADSMVFIAGLPDYRVMHGCRLVHGFPPDSPTLYLFQVLPEDRQKALQDLPERICFVGHTHVLDLIRHDGRKLANVAFNEGANRLDPALQYLVNIGSVGQPRDGDPRAKYVIWNPVESTLDIRCVPYDAQAAAAKIIAAGMPGEHAHRLLG
ncbi:MAG: metallophosphoesterase family protein [Deltaproteobacteria bacterium]|nr:metallophosphoesterase family protein [Deltaproteobacteria bacterium]